MAGSLLFFPILRTRSARKKLVAGAVIVLLASLGGCEEDFSRSPELAARSSPGSTEDTPSASSEAREGAGRRAELSRRLAEQLEALEVEAGVERGRDPAAPGGDLRRDLEEFTTVDACVRAHRVTDPLLADAVDALGYDTLVRDACRTLQALKSKDTKPCQPIAAAALRMRCESQVAVLAGEPALCPLVSGGGPVPAREPVCLARASRDERLCAAARGSDRTVCQALVRGRSSECGNDDVCVRQVERFRALLEKPVSHAPFPARLHVEFASERGKPEQFDGAFDLEDLAAAGAVARPMGDKIRFMIGMPKTALWPGWDSSLASPRLFLAVSLPSKPKNEAAHRADAAAGLSLGVGDLALDLLIPRIALLDGTLASERSVTVENVSASTGSPLKFTLTTKIHDAARTFRVKVELETFVRDGVTARPGEKKGP
jgi:hypothetical protein